MTDMNRKLEEIAEQSPAFAMWLAVTQWQKETPNEMPEDAAKQLGNAVPAKGDETNNWNFLLSEDEGGFNEAAEKYLATMPELKAQEAKKEEDDG